MWLYYVVLAILNCFMALLLYHLYIQTNRIGRLTNSVPGPKALPILGNLLQLKLSLGKYLIIISYKWQKIDKKFFVC